MGDKRWYLARDGQMEGPYTQGEVAEKISTGEVDEHFFVFGPGNKQWQPLTDSEAFADFLTANPPPPPPPVAPSPPPNAPSPPTQKAEANKSRHTGIAFGTLLTISGLGLSYVAYEPFQWEVFGVHDDGMAFNYGKYKHKQDCMDYLHEVWRRSIDERERSPNANWGKIPNMECRKFCSNKLDCLLGGL